MGAWKRGKATWRRNKMLSKWELPKPVTMRDIAFGPVSMKDYLPVMEEIPAEFKDGRSRWVGFIAEWFFRGLSKPRVGALKAKPGVDKLQALGHVKAVIGSYAPKHEHKEAGCAYLMSLWFEAPT